LCGLGGCKVFRLAFIPPAALTSALSSSPSFSLSFSLPLALSFFTPPSALDNQASGEARESKGSPRRVIMPRINFYARLFSKGGCLLPSRRQRKGLTFQPWASLRTPMSVPGHVCAYACVRVCVRLVTRPSRGRFPGFLLDNHRLLVFPFFPLFPSFFPISFCGILMEN
jgi:hypothetical protein